MSNLYDEGHHSLWHFRKDDKPTVFLSSPRTQQQCEHLAGQAVLLSYPLYAEWMKSYLCTWPIVLIDSGAFSAYNSGKLIDREKYFRWSLRFKNWAAIACLDNISGDTDKTIANCEFMPEGMGFPTFHETDPWDALPVMCDLAYKHGNYIGLGLKPPRAGKGEWVRRACSMIPDDLHVHGWACREYTYVYRIDSVDSTNWLLDSMRVQRDIPWLTFGECIDIIVKRYERESRKPEAEPDPETLWGAHERNIWIPTLDDEVE